MHSSWKRTLTYNRRVTDSSSVKRNIEEKGSRGAPAVAGGTGFARTLSLCDEAEVGDGGEERKGRSAEGTLEFGL